MIISQKEKIKLYFLILIFFFISRTAFFYMGIQPNVQIFKQMWQVMDFRLLENYYFSSLYYLHYQPPVWNLIIGLFIKIFGNSYENISVVIHIFNLLITLISIILLLKFCFLLSLKKSQIYFISIIYLIISLSYLFYENYLHYTHLTTLLFLLFIYNYFKFVKSFNIKYEFYIYITASILVFTWSAYSHPLFILLIFFSTILIKFKYKILRSFLIFFLFFVISVLPSIKNKVEINFFGNSTWLGVQIIQVLKRWDVLNGMCNMNFNKINIYEQSFVKENNFINKHPSLIGDLSKWNNVGMIYKTQKCLNYGIYLIKDDPLNYFSIVKFNFISTHGHFAFDHGFKPSNWDNYFSFFDQIKENRFLNSIKVRSIQIYYFLMYLFFTIILIKSILNIKNKNVFNYQKATSSIFLIYVWMILLTHMFAGFEQERMRHIGHFLHVLFFIILLKNNFNILKILRQNQYISV